jgi:ANTAR domain
LLLVTLGGSRQGMSVNGPTGRDGEDDDVVVRKAEHGWVVHGENVSDLTSAMVLADLFAADQAADDDTRLLEAVDENGHPRRPSGGAIGQTGNGKHRATQQQTAPHEAAQRGVARPPAPRPPSGPPPGWSNGPAGQPAPSVRDNDDDEAARLAVTVAQLEHALASRVRVEQAIGVLAERHRLRPREAFDLLRGAARSRGRRVTEIAQDVVASAANPLLRLPEELSRKLPEPRQRGRSLRRARHAEQF